MNNTLKTILFGLLMIVLILGNMFLFSKKSALENQLSHSKQLEERMKFEVDSLSDDKVRLNMEKDKLQADAASYLSANEKLQDEKDTLKSGLEKAQKTLDTQESEMARLKQNLQKVEKKIVSEHSGDDSTAIKEAKELKKKIYLMDKKIRGERALYHYNLGVALSQAKRYEVAATEYEKALEMDPDNAEAHYNLALICDEVADDANKAVFHYRAYLNLKKNAPDKEEVEKAIDNLK